VRQVTQVPFGIASGSRSYARWDLFNVGAIVGMFHDKKEAWKLPVGFAKEKRKRMKFWFNSIAGKYPSEANHQNRAAITSCKY